MTQPFLDLMDYDAKHPGGDHERFLCNGTKTDGRFGFNPTSRFTDCSAITPYGMRILENRFCQVVQDFEVFNYQVLKALCESPLPDVVVLNIVDNAVNYAVDGDPRHSFIMTYYGFNHHSNDAAQNYWSECGCNCLVEWAGKRKVVSLKVAELLATTGRLTIIPFHERFVPRYEDELDLIYYPHLGAIDRYGKPFDIEELKRRKHVRRIQKSSSAAV